MGSGSQKRYLLRIIIIPDKQPVGLDMALQRPCPLALKGVFLVMCLKRCSLANFFQQFIEFGRVLSSSLCELIVFLEPSRPLYSTHHSSQLTSP